MEYKIKGRIQKAYSDYKEVHYNTKAGKMRLSDLMDIIGIAKDEQRAKGRNAQIADEFMTADIAFKSAYAIGYNAGLKEGRGTTCKKEK